MPGGSCATRNCHELPRVKSDRIKHGKTLATSARLAEQVLEKNPQHPGANEAVGFYTCFERNQWKDGLPHLTRVADTTLAEIARRDQSSPTSALDRVALADSWVRWIESQPDRESLTPAVFQRAVSWYASAIPQLDDALRQEATAKLTHCDDHLLSLSWSSVRNLPWTGDQPGQVRAFVGHEAGVTALQVDRTGRSAWSASMDGSVRQWDLISGSDLQQLSPGFQSVYSIALAARGRLLFAEGHTDELAVWDAASGRRDRPLVNKYDVRHIAASSEGNLLACVLNATNNNVVLINTTSRKSLGALSIPGSNNGVSFSPDNLRLLVTGSTGVACWSIQTGQRLLRVSGTGSTTRCIFAPDGRSLVVADDRGVRVVNAFRGSTALTLAIPSVTCLLFNSNGSLLLTGDDHGQVSAWNVETGGKVGSFDVTDGGSDAEVSSMAALPDPHAILIGDSSGRVKLWRVDATSTARTP